jgi:hypothetical protein
VKVGRKPVPTLRAFLLTSRDFAADDCATLAAEDGKKHFGEVNKMKRGQINMKKVTALALLAALLLATLAACGGEAKTVPNVMGIDHSSAKTVIENAGFTVTEMEYWMCTMKISLMLVQAIH